MKEILEKRICPVSKNYLARLIRHGEEYKKGELREGLNYILAMNIGSGEKRARWAVSRDEIEAWKSRAKNNSFKKRILGEDYGISTRDGGG